MRRFASVFVRKDKKEKTPAATTAKDKSPDVVRPVLLSSPASTLSTPQLSIASDPAHSSASSDSHGPSVHTPTDDLPPKRSWRAWIAPKRSLSLKSPSIPPPLPEWPPEPPSDPHDDQADDELDDHYDHLNTPVHNFSLLLTHSLQPPLPVSPFVQHSLGPFFPRSANRPSLLQPSSDTRKAMFRRHLLAALHHSHPSPHELSHFASLPASSPHLSPPVPHFSDSVHPASTNTKTFPSSPGLRRWLNRPCFEDRYQVYLATDDAILTLPVSAASLAVAALEYSEHIDVMVDPDFDKYAYHPEKILLDLEPIIQQTQSHAPLPAFDSQPTPAPKRNSYTPSPSPLRHQTNEPAPPKSILKRNVRFAEDDSSDPEDALPLHVVRMKKKREQKADFLRQERLKRLREEQEERRRLEAEAREKEQQAIEREQRRIALEKERKEKEKALYAESIAATRLRREGNRAGVVVPLNNSSLAASPSFSSLKDSERNNSRRFSRSTHDPPPSISIPRKDSSDFALHPPALHQYDSSPGSSRPPSIGHSPITPHSRPPSTYSTHTSSSEDVRHQTGSWRNSVNVAAAAAAAGGGNYPRPPVIVSYPTWSGSNPNFQYIPPVPPFPDYVHDMPLLPPAAPFMKRSYRSRSPSSSSRSRKESSGSSTERVNKIPPTSPKIVSSTPTPPRHPHQQLRQSSAPTPRTTTTTKTNTSTPTHQRSGSGESRGTTRTRTSQHTSQQVPSSRSQTSLSRGRSLQPPYIPAPPNAWTSLPPQMQMQMSSPQMMMMMPSYPQMGMGPMNMGMNMALASASASNLHNMGGGNMSSGSVGRGHPTPSRRHTQPIIS